MFDTVVVMDRDLTRRQFLYQILTQVNYQVTTVPSPHELLECLKRERPYCVVLGGIPSAQASAMTLGKLRQVDQQLKVVVLTPADQVEALGALLRPDARSTVLNAGLDQRAIIRALLGVLKEREVERIDAATAFQGHILVIEDDPSASELLSGYLERRGYHVIAAANGEEALVQMRVKRPAVVILDILLPGMDGMLTLKRLKALNPSVSVIISSGLDDAQLMEEAKSSGAAAYLIKPFDLSKLEAAILATSMSAGSHSPRPSPAPADQTQA